MKIQKSLAKFGKDISIARRKRNLTAAMMSERLGIAQSTYLRVEKGNPTVALGVYAMALFCLGLGDVFGDLIDVSKDHHGLILDEERLRKRVHRKNGTFKKGDP
jgi:transcriptional regulator with XRE-family HTH domain